MRKSDYLSLIVIPFLCTSCNLGLIQRPLSTATFTLAPTNTLTLTYTPTLTNTSTSTPTLTLTPTMTLTPTPWGGASGQIVCSPGITAYNISGSELMRDQTIYSSNGIYDLDWSPDGSSVAFSMDDDIYIKHVADSNAIKLTDSPVRDSLPRWSPDGKLIGFTSHFGEGIQDNVDMFVISPDGTGLTNLTRNPAVDGAPIWSPDGKLIAFVSNRSGNWDIFLMNRDGTEVTNLTNNPGNDGDPDWSPDGNAIAFRSNREVILRYTSTEQVIRLLLD